jgi:hypothetical protein
MFASCDTLYVAAEADIAGLPAAEACYDSTWDLGFVSDSMEVLRQNRLGEISDKRNAMKDLLEDAKDAMSLGDTAKAVGILADNAGYVLLRSDEQDEWKAIVGLKQ